MRILGTIFAGLFGLVFGSFLNVCLSRWPEGESVVKPRSRCRTCGRTLTWWENVPVLSWLALRGRCRTCGASIALRYVVVELAVGVLWAYVVWRYLGQFEFTDMGIHLLAGSQMFPLISALAVMIFCFLLVGVAVLDAEHFWIADAITLPGIILGLLFGSIFWPGAVVTTAFWKALGWRVLAVLVAAALVLLIRWLYWLVRRKEGMGLGDAKLMAMLAAWLGLPGALLAFFIGIVIGAGMAVIMLVAPKRNEETWATRKLPLGTFLCIGGIVSSLWGRQIIDAYLRLSGF